MCSHVFTQFPPWGFALFSPKILARPNMQYNCQILIWGWFQGDVPFHFATINCWNSMFFYQLASVMPTHTSVRRRYFLVKRFKLQRELRCMQLQFWAPFRHILPRYKSLQVGKLKRPTLQLLYLGKICPDGLKIGVNSTFGQSPFWALSLLIKKIFESGLLTLFLTSTNVHNWLGRILQIKRYFLCY